MPGSQPTYLDNLRRCAAALRDLAHSSAAQADSEEWPDPYDEQVELDLMQERRAELEEEGRR